MITVGASLMRRRLSTFLAMLIAMSFNIHAARAYETAEHEDIAERAKTNYLQYVSQHLDTAVGAEPLATAYWNTIKYYVVHEDDGANPKNHFWDPVLDTGIYAWIPFFAESAKVRANRFIETSCDAYKDGDYDTAYQYLGRVMHLVADMGVPAHVLLDDHYEYIPQVDFHDWYEHTYIAVAAHKPTSTTDLDTESALPETLMLVAATRARKYDSGPQDGEWAKSQKGTMDDGTRMAGGFVVDPNANPPIDEGAPIANDCYWSAVKECGGLLKLFYHRIKPGVILVKPVDEDVTSGLVGVQLHAKANSCSREYTDPNSKIQKVVYEYTLVDPPQFQDYTQAGYKNEIDSQDSLYKYRWTNSLNRNKVWVRARAIDTGQCPSLPYPCWIKIDSERPKVLNKKP